MLNLNNSEQNKPKVAMDISTQGKGGGPYTSTKRIMNSSLTEEFLFYKIVYDPSIGKGISLKRIIDIRDQIIRINPDVVHFTGLQLSGFHMAVACYLAKVPYRIVTIRGSSADAIEFSPIKRFVLSKILEPLTLILSHKIVGVSDYVTNSKVPRYLRKKIYGTVYNFPPLKKSTKVSSGITREKLGFKKEDVIVITVGRINREKGLHILESAISKIGYDNNIKFIIVGEGDYLNKMKENLSNQINEGQVKFLGYLDDVFEVNNISDIFVLPTLHETLSNALLEASSASLPMIASNTGGVPEIVKNGLNGILVEPGNVLQLINAIEKLACDSNLRAVYAKNALNRVQTKFSGNEIENKLRNLYQECNIKKNNSKIL